MNKLIQFQMRFNNVEIRGDKIVIEGYASTPSLDSYNTVIPVDVVKEGLSVYKSNPVILLQHNAEKPIGKCLEWEVDDGGWRITAEIINNTDGVIDDIKNDITKGFSIGFIPKGRVYIDTRNGEEVSNLSEEEQEKIPYEKIGRRFTEVVVKEVSVVTTPANDQSLFTIKRALNLFFKEMEIRMVSNEKRILISDQSNPFIDKEEKEEEEKETEETEIDETEEIKETEENTETDDKKEENIEKEEEIEEKETESEEATGEKSEETQQEDSSGSNTHEEQPNDADENSDSENSTTTDDDGNDGENPDESQSDEDQNGDSEDIQTQLEKERALNDDLLGTVELLAEKLQTLESRLSKVAVNKPKVYVRNTEADPLRSSMIQAKRGF